VPKPRVFTSDRPATWVKAGFRGSYMQVQPQAAAAPPAGLPRIISKSEYARHRGWSPPYVSKLIRTEKLTPPALLPDGRIDRLTADAQLAARRERVTSDDDELPPPAPAATLEVDEDGDETLIALKREVERERRRKLRRENDEAEARLVDAEAVRRRTETAARMTRDAIRRLPAKVAGRLAAETDETAIRALLLAAIDELLNDAADAHQAEAETDDEDGGGEDDAGIG
jgi:hypothetical protein